MFAGCSYWPDLPADISAACTPTHFKFGSFSARALLSLAVTDSTAYCIWPGFQAHKNALSLAFLRKIQCYSGPARARVPPTPRPLVSNRSWERPASPGSRGRILDPSHCRKKLQNRAETFYKSKPYFAWAFEKRPRPFVGGGRAKKGLPFFRNSRPTF